MQRRYDEARQGHDALQEMLDEAETRHRAELEEASHQQKLALLETLDEVDRARVVQEMLVNEAESGACSCAHSTCMHS